MKGTGFAVKKSIWGRAINKLSLCKRTRDAKFLIQGRCNEWVVVRTDYGFLRASSRWGGHG